MLKHQFLNLEYPPEVLAPGSSTVAPSPKTADDINDLFKTLDTEEPVVEKKEPKVIEKEDDEPELDEKDDELDLVDTDEEIEKLDLKETDDIGDIEAPPRKKEILKEYPELFKKFPFLEKMMYRDKQLMELFGSFDDAKEIAEKSETFKEFETQLLSGDTAEILKNVKESDERAFNIIVDDYLPTLAKVDEKAYYHVVGNLNRRLIMEMVQEANDTNNDDLKQAALLVNQFVFGTAKFTAPTKLVDRKDDPAKNEVEAERLSYVKERFETSRDELQSRVDNTLKATISEYIDPKGVMSSYVKKNAVSDAMKILSASIVSDPMTVKNLDKLWKASFESKFSKDTLGKIQSYYLSKAKGNLKNAIIKARAEALKDVSPRKEEKEETETEEPRRVARQIPTGKPSQPTKKGEMKKGETVSDFFMRD